MKIYDINNFNKYSNSIITIGIFDGIHIGHQKILQKIKLISQKKKKKNILITFWPHPKLILFNNYALKLLNSFKEKIHTLSSHGIDILLKINFTKKFSQINYLDFIKKVLINKIRLEILIIGYDSKFGKNKDSNFKKLKLYSFLVKFKLNKIIPITTMGNIISSTKVRKILSLGAVELANKYLGRPYLITGNIINGMKLGRKINFPTINLKTNFINKLIPCNGVYAVIIIYNNIYYKGIMNIGFKPTFNSLLKTIESYVINFKKNIYQNNVIIFFLNKIRNEIRFNSLKSLKNQLKKDKKKALTLLSFL